MYSVTQELKQMLCRLNTSFNGREKLPQEKPHKPRLINFVRPFYVLLNEDAVAYYYILGKSFLNLATEY